MIPSTARTEYGASPPDDPPQLECQDCGHCEAAEYFGRDVWGDKRCPECRSDALERI